MWYARELRGGTRVAPTATMSWARRRVHTDDPEILAMSFIQWRDRGTIYLDNWLVASYTGDQMIIVEYHLSTSVSRIQREWQN